MVRQHGTEGWRRGRQSFTLTCYARYSDVGTHAVTRPWQTHTAARRSCSLPALRCCLRYQSPLPAPYGSYIKLYSSNHDKPQNQNRCTAATAHALAAWLKNAQSVRIAAGCACVTRNHYPHACSGGSSRARRCCSRSSMHKYIHPWGAGAVAAAAAAPEG